MTIKERLAVIENQIKDIFKDMGGLVTNDRFNPIEKIVWAITMAILLGAVGAILKVIFI